MVREARKNATNLVPGFSQLTPAGQVEMGRSLTDSAESVVEEFRASIAQFDLEAAQVLGEKALRQIAIAQGINENLKDEQLGVRGEVSRDQRMERLRSLQKEVSEGIPGDVNRSAVGLVTALNLNREAIESLIRVISGKVDRDSIPSLPKTRMAAGHIGASNYERNMLAVPTPPAKPQSLSERYEAYLNGLMAQAKAQAEETIRTLIPTFNKMPVEQQRNRMQAFINEKFKATVARFRNP
jgi:hypothetical protein